MTKILILVFLFGFAAVCYADTVYLQNGRSIEGLISTEDENSIELEVGQGRIKFKKSEIAKIERSAPEESYAIREHWERQKIAAQERISLKQREEELKPRKIEFSAASQSIIVKVTLNKKVEASLVLDTGASLVLLRKSIAEKLGIDLDRIEPNAKVILADGRQVNAKYTILESVKLENVEAKDVETMILTDEVANLNVHDGLLGMSFLKRFNFKIDQKEKKLTLEKF